MLSRLRCSRLPSRAAQPLPPEIERRDRERQCGSFRASRASRVAPDSGKAPETREKTRPRLLPVEIGWTAWRWGESGANRSRPLDAAIAPRRPPRNSRGRSSWAASAGRRTSAFSKTARYHQAILALEATVFNSASEPASLANRVFPGPIPASERAWLVGFEVVHRSYHDRLVR